MEVADRLAATEGLVNVAMDAPPATIANICCVMFTGNEEVSAEQIRTGHER